ncbi:TPA: hypothetical protein SAJ25_000645 [Campylobacter jejuni]|uniref:hypothetical protein n=1 Tax=Campylobacter jejuni TaxID=197 RepID=UPI000444BDE5|nr:hypothetical protein [Campylobacter jejuni]AHW91562.1 hypothetical protein H730_03200 [Campylobacter jejuni subsp. jejuni R14]AYA31995.1 hypothetical protein D3Z18_04565 [Campylobacter jejuni subsp. jejuni]EAK7649252.1 hypothetical protein [Campylobacter jejuni]ECL1878752.1 hypothetical protein [Campylobacter jejuni]ECO5759181.1 hypothetical protein [Campylobacter jejuni]
MIPNFIASFDVALGRKSLRERKGYLKLSNTIAYGGLSVDALALYIQLAKLSEKTIVSEIYLREFIKVKNNQRISLNRLRIAKKELIELRLLEIKKVRNGSLNFYEWILKDETYQVKKHFNKSLSLLKSSDEKLSKTLKNNTSSIDRKLTTENEKNQNFLYIETRTHARDNKFINNININNNKFIKKENLENLKNNQEKKERVFNQNASFVVSFLKLDEKECEKMAKKEFKVPNANELMGQIMAFNEKNGTNFGEELANDFIGYWDAREWKRNGKRMSSVAGSLYTWLKYAKENEARKNQRFNRKKEANPSVVDSLMEYYGMKDENKNKLLGCF